MPDTIMLEGVGGLVLAIIAAITLIYFYGRNQRDIGYEEGRADQYAALGTLAEMAELADHDAEPGGDYLGRHACTQPRQQADAIPPASGERPPWYISTALLTPSPAPALTGAADTGTLSKVTETGEFRAASEQDIAQRSADNAAWLEKWAAGATS